MHGMACRTKRSACYAGRQDREKDGAETKGAEAAIPLPSLRVLGGSDGGDDQGVGADV